MTYSKSLHFLAATIISFSRIFFLLTIFIPSLFLLSFAQQGEWTWMNGDNVSFGLAVYGTQGVPDPANRPASLYESVEWTDHDGNFWLFGGLRDFGFEYNTMWKFDPLTNQWTWMRGSTSCCTAGVYGTQGVPAPANMPGARAWGTCSWVDNAGNLWLYGGIGYDATGATQVLSDLWMYNISSGQWTWMNGPNMGTIPVNHGTMGVFSPNNLPGARAESNASWTDNNNNLWMFGGALYFPQSGGWSIGGFGNDLWEFDMNIMQWAWIKGTTVLTGPGIYGIQGVPGFSNYPGGRGSYSKWKDADDNLWLFGGYDLGNCWNDLWRYNILDNTWTWMSGPNTLNNNGNYGTQCVPDVNNIPPSRYENRTFWMDGLGNFWLWGGIRNTLDVLNDLWVYQPATNEWTWVSGSTAPNQLGNYGTILQSSPANMPPAKYGSIGWRDADGNLWVQGGSTALFEARNDLWRYMPDLDCPMLQDIDFDASATKLCEKFCIDFFDSSVNNPTSWLWSFPGGVPSTSTAQNPANICYQASGTFSVTLITTSAAGNDTLTIPDYITVFTNPFAPTITQSGNILTSSPAFSYQWQLNAVNIPGATSQSLTITQQGLYTVLITTADGCSAQSSINASVVGIEEIADQAICVYPNPSNGNFIIEWLDIDIPVDDEFKIEVRNSTGQTIFSFLENISGQHFKKEVDLGTQPSGIYFIQIKSSEHVLIHKVILVK